MKRLSTLFWATGLATILNACDSDSIKVVGKCENDNLRIEAVYYERSAEIDFLTFRLYNSQEYVGTIVVADTESARILNALYCNGGKEMRIDQNIFSNDRVYFVSE